MPIDQQLCDKHLNIIYKISSIANKVAIKINKSEFGEVQSSCSYCVSRTERRGTDWQKARALFLENRKATAGWIERTLRSETYWKLGYWGRGCWLWYAP